VIASSVLQTVVQPEPRDATAWQRQQVRLRLCSELPNQGQFLIIKCIAGVLKELIPCWQGKERDVFLTEGRDRGRDSVYPITNAVPATSSLHNFPLALCLNPAICPGCPSAASPPLQLWGCPRSSPVLVKTRRGPHVFVRQGLEPKAGA